MSQPRPTSARQPSSLLVVPIQRKRQKPRQPKFLLSSLAPLISPVGRARPVVYINDQPNAAYNIQDEAELSKEAEHAMLGNRS
jgi:hypothetical protein